MPHLIIDYSANIEERADIQRLCAVMRDALLATGLFPLGGIRVRGHRADHVCIADGQPELAYLDMVLRIGEGRTPEQIAPAIDSIYAAAEAYLEPKVDPVPFALSLTLQEMSPTVSRKSFNTIHGALKSQDERQPQ